MPRLAQQLHYLRSNVGEDDATGRQTEGTCSLRDVGLTNSGKA